MGSYSSKPIRIDRKARGVRRLDTLDQSASKASFSVRSVALFKEGDDDGQSIRSGGQLLHFATC